MTGFGAGPKMRFGKPYKKVYATPTPKSESWDELEDTNKVRPVVSPSAARQQRVYRVSPVKNSASKKADQLGTSGSKSSSSAPRDIRKRKLMLDD